MTAPAVLPPSLAPITEAISAALAVALGRPIGDAGAPPNAVPPYAFLTRIDARWDGSLLSAFEVVTAVYQLQCVGLDSGGAEWLESRAMAALLTAPVIPGWHVVDWEPLGSPGGVRPDRDLTPHLYVSTPQWRLIAQPEGTS